MTKRHLKSYVAPKGWALKRKEHKFVVKPSPGPHNIELSMPLSLLIKRIGLAQTNKEVRKILQQNLILVDQKKVKDYKFPVGLMDAVSIKDVEKNFRVILDNKGKLMMKEIKSEEAKLKTCKIIKKTILSKGRLQLNLFDGRNIITTENGQVVGDSVVISLPDQKIKDKLKLDKGSFVLLMGGKHIGDVGTLEKIDGDKIVYASKSGKLVETLKEYAFVIKEDLLK